MPAISIPAERGHPYLISAHPRGTVCVTRRSSSDRQNTIELTPADAVKVCNAVIDLLEDTKES